MGGRERQMNIVESEDNRRRKGGVRVRDKERGIERDGGAKRGRERWEGEKDR